MHYAKAFAALTLTSLCLSSSACLVEGIDDIIEDMVQDAQKGVGKQARDQEFFAHCTSLCEFLVPCGDKSYGESLPECLLTCVEEQQEIERDAVVGCADLLMDTHNCVTQRGVCSDWFSWLKWTQDELQGPGPVCDRITRSTEQHCS